MGAILTRTAAIGRHNQVISPGVLHNVLPVDGISMTQELVLVHVHPSIQNFWQNIKK